VKRLLPRLLSRWNVASRKVAEQLVHDGRVRVDGRVVRDVLAMVDERARVEVDGAVVGAASDLVWLALNKPRGVVTTTDDPEGRQTVLDLVPQRIAGLAPVGRLDRDSAGLILLTNDHALAAALLDPATHVTKRYRVKVRGHPDEAILHGLRTTTLVEDGLALGSLEVAVVELGPRSAWLEIALAEGKNRQIRRRLEAVGHPVEVLIRTAFGPIGLGELAPGAVRRLEASECAALGQATTPR
jgi:23S rRNA pseudouridine2605 synthase